MPYGKQTGIGYGYAPRELRSAAVAQDTATEHEQLQGREQSEAFGDETEAEDHEQHRLLRRKRRNR